MPDVPEVLPEILLRLVAAAVLGAILGIDRELRGKPAGMRTHALVAVGAALMTVIGFHVASAEATFDPNVVSRVIQGIIAGIGFLGGGAILKGVDNGDVRGLTTAASMWIVAALGIACGAGQWVAAVVTVVLGIVILVLGNFFERAVRRALGPWFNKQFGPPEE